MLYDDNKIESVDYQIYNKWFDTFIDEFDVTNIVYIKTDPSMCLKRVEKRGRDGEGNIPIEYLQSCGEYHNNMMTKMESDIHILDGNVNINTSPQIINTWIDNIKDIVDKVHTNIIANCSTSRPSSSGSDSIKSKMD
tara:strand:- start:114 stop:524 length:411 start_codon:yes stop_codon:yes gene_type:complete